MHTREERTSMPTGPTNPTNLAGLADACELIAATFAYPADGRLAAALADGSYARDARECLADAGVAGATIDTALGGVDGLLGRDPAELAKALRTGHSLLFLAPGTNVAAWPYEAAFRFVSQGRQGAPSLFRSPIALDVERHMRAAGVLPEHARTEPPDSVWNEFGFMAYLLAQALQTLRTPQTLCTPQAEDGAHTDGSHTDGARTDNGSDGHNGGQESAAVWIARARDFSREHMAPWIPAFMEKVVQACDAPEQGRRALVGTEYAAFAQVGSLVWDTLSSALGTKQAVSRHLNTTSQ